MSLHIANLKWCVDFVSYRPFLANMIKELTKKFLYTISACLKIPILWNESGLASLIGA